LRSLLWDTIVNVPTKKGGKKGGSRIGQEFYDGKINMTLACSEKLCVWRRDRRATNG